jgi:hypothetical protein
VIRLEFILISITGFILISYFLINFNLVHAIKDINQTISLVHVENKEPIKVDDIYSLALLIAAIITIGIAFPILFIEKLIKSKETEEKLYNLLLLALNETKKDLTDEKRIKDYGKIKGDKYDYIDAYFDLNPYEVIFNTDFFAHLHLKTQNYLSTLFSYLKLNNELINRIKDIDDISFIFRSRHNIEAELKDSPITKHREEITECQHEILKLFQLAHDSIDHKKREKFYNNPLVKELLND